MIISVDHDPNNRNKISDATRTVLPNVSKKTKLTSEGPTLDCVGLFHCMQIGPPRPSATKYFTLTAAACERRVGRPNYATPQLSNGPISIPETARPPICPFHATDFVIPVGIALIKSRRASATGSVEIDFLYKGLNLGVLLNIGDI